MSDDTFPARWAAAFDPEGVPGVIRALRLLEDAGHVPADDGRAWRVAIANRWGVFVAAGSA